MSVLLGGNVFVAWIRGRGSWGRLTIGRWRGGSQRPPVDRVVCLLHLHRDGALLERSQRGRCNSPTWRCSGRPAIGAPLSYSLGLMGGIVMADGSAGAPIFLYVDYAVCAFPMIQRRINGTFATAVSRSNLPLSLTPRARFMQSTNGMPTAKHAISPSGWSASGCMSFALPGRQKESASSVSAKPTHVR